MDREEINGGRLTPEERRERVKKLKRKRKIRLAIVVGGFASVFLLLISTVVLSFVFRVRNFIVEGDTLYSNEEIVAASGIENGKSLFFADLDSAKVNIETKLPYTVNVQLTRKLPDKIIIRLESTDKAYAVEKSEGLYAITNRDFKVLEISGVIPEGVVPVIGATPETAEPGQPLSFVDDGEDDATLELIRNISSAIANAELDDVNLISIRSRSNVYLIYQERVVMRLGDSSDADKKIELGKRAVESQDELDGVQVGIINLTVAKKAYFKPSDIKDIPEFDEYESYVLNKEKDSEEIAYAIERKNGSYAITNRSFKVLDFASTAPEGIIPIEGYIPENAKTGEMLGFGSEEETDAAYETLKDVYEAVTESGIENVNLIGFDDGDVYLICGERAVFRIGSTKNIENKLSKGKKLMAAEAEDAVGIIELDDVDNAYFDETAYEDIDELMDFNPDYEAEEDDTEE
ncbi:MAG: FtsQ-type POTRA domain-containing protein [Clostridia bacterium]|nr:FtsQ-type POTRA domain-containing protein [Clostridia bacterium]